MKIERAIELLGKCESGAVTFDDDFKEAVRMAKKALTLLAYERPHRLDDLSLKLLLNADREEA